MVLSVEESMHHPAVYDTQDRLTPSRENKLLSGSQGSLEKDLHDVYTNTDPEHLLRASTPTILSECYT
jgi:hypothetical protein